MSNEKYLGEAALKDKPKKKLTLKIRKGSITPDQLSDEIKAAIGSMSPVTEEEINSLFSNKVIPDPTDPVVGGETFPGELNPGKADKE